MIEHLVGLHVGFKQVERSGEDLGEEIAQDEMTIVQNGNPCSRIMYLGVDGTGCPMLIEETKGRPGKQSDGSSKTCEVKLAVIFSTDNRDKNGKPVRGEGLVTSNAATGDLDQDISEFACRVERETQRRGFDRAQRQVIIGDGAVWIWTWPATYFRMQFKSSICIMPRVQFPRPPNKSLV